MPRKRRKSFDEGLQDELRPYKYGIAACLVTLIVLLGLFLSSFPNARKSVVFVALMVMVFAVMMRLRWIIKYKQEKDFPFRNWN